MQILPPCHADKDVFSILLLSKRVVWCATDINRDKSREYWHFHWRPIGLAVPAAGRRRLFRARPRAKREARSRAHAVQFAGLDRVRRRRGRAGDVNAMTT